MGSLPYGIPFTCVHVMTKLIAFTCGNEKKTVTQVINEYYYYYYYKLQKIYFIDIYIGQLLPLEPVIE